MYIPIPKRMSSCPFTHQTPDEQHRYIYIFTYIYIIYVYNIYIHIFSAAEGKWGRGAAAVCMYVVCCSMHVCIYTHISACAFICIHKYMYIPGTSLRSLLHREDGEEALNIEDRRAGCVSSTSILCVCMRIYTYIYTYICTHIYIYRYICT